MNDFEKYSPDFSNLLPERKRDAYKNQCGKVGIIAGSSSMLGAAVLTALATLRAGSGLVYLMTVSDAMANINVVYPEIIVLPLPSEKGSLTVDSLLIIEQYIEEYKFDSLAIGPGLGRELCAEQLIRRFVDLCMQKELLCVVDADALNAIKDDQLRDYVKTCLVLTPHPGEFMRLFDKRVSSDNEDRIRIVQEVITNLNQVLVLKGHNTIVADRSRIYFNETGNSGMATAGAGDVLTGIIASFIGQGLLLFESSVLGVYLHGLAGDKAYDKLGNSLLATDIIDYLPEAIMEIGNND
jgi:hydroxyethylthiazole kinase-like uncharacterized protein yjeF